MSAETTSGARTFWRWARVVGGLLVLVVVAWRVGTQPFLDGIRLVDGRALVAAVALGFVTTLCSAWRWALVSRSLGDPLPLREAIAAYYRSQFLNVTLPGGVVGDVHRAVRQGREVGDLALGVRAVVLERFAGQIVTIVLAVLVLAAFPSPVRQYLPYAAVITALGVAGLVAAGGSAWGRRVLGIADTSFRRGRRRAHRHRHRPLQRRGAERPSGHASSSPRGPPAHVAIADPPGPAHSCSPCWPPWCR